MNFRRYFNRYKSRILLLFIVILIFYIFLISKSENKPEFSSSNDGFSEVDIEYELEQYKKLKNEYQLTGIILHWRRLNGVRYLVELMLKHEDLFPYIIIWNNNPSKKLTFDDLSIKKTDRIQIIQSDMNIKDQAKYRSCELAKTKACFYIDDDWDMSLYIRSLYANFLLEPTILHAITDQFTYYTNLMWTFFDSQIDLHTGFSWIGCGSIFSRENAIRHLKYLTYFLDNDENRDLLPQGDQFFAIWMNQFPSQFNGRMIHSSEGASSSFENYDFDRIQHRASVLAIEVLEKTLRHSPGSQLFDRQRASNIYATYTKSSCSYNDRFFFFTNCFPIDNLEQIPFNITSDSQRGTRSNLPNNHRSPYHDGLRFFEQFNTANAVDNDSTTCWKSHHSIRTGDIYGIDFHTIQTHGDLSFSIEFFHEQSLQENLDISISLNSIKWISIPRSNQFGIVYNRSKNLVTFHTRLFAKPYQIFRMIKFTALTDDTRSFHICEVKLIH